MRSLREAAPAALRTISVRATGRRVLVGGAASSIARRRDGRVMRRGLASVPVGRWRWATLAYCRKERRARAQMSVPAVAAISGLRTMMAISTAIPPGLKTYAGVQVELHLWVSSRLAMTVATATETSSPARRGCSRQDTGLAARRFPNLITTATNRPSTLSRRRPSDSAISIVSKLRQRIAASRVGPRVSRQHAVPLPA